MPPRDIKSLLEWLKNRGELNSLITNPLSQWGPRNRVMLSADFLPPRVVAKNQDTIEKVHFRTIAAIDGTRHSPAQIIESGHLFGKINYRLGYSDLARQVVGPDYEGIMAYLNRKMPMQAAAALLGLTDTLLLQAMVEHDELANWEAIVYNHITRRGDNAYYEYEDGPSLAGHRVAASVDWSNPAVDPWVSDIIPRIKFLVALGYDKAGIRIVTSERVMQVLADHPATLRRSYAGPILFSGQTIDEVNGVVTTSDVSRVFSKLGVQAPVTHELRVQTITGEKRAYPEDHMTFIASTGQTENVLFNTSNPAEVRIVENTLGFSAIGTANAQTSPGRRVAGRSFTDQKDARIELEGWQATGPVILNPTAISDISGIDLGD